MYLIEHFSRLHETGREDTVSLYMPALDPEHMSPEMQEGVATFMRMAATFAKMAMMQGKAENLEAACRLLNRAMQDCAPGDSK